MSLVQGFIATSFIAVYNRELTFWLNEQPYLLATPDWGLRTQTKKEDKHWNKHQTDSGEAFPWCEFSG